MDKHLKMKPYTPWMLLKLYWQSNQRFSAIALLSLVILFTILLVGFDVAFTTFYNYFYNALQDYDKRGAIDLLVIFCFMAALYIVLAVYRYYVQAFLGLRWRKWLTAEFVERWLYKRSYYILENFDVQTDNPDQRIQEDIQSLVTLSLSLLIGLISSFVTIFAFIYVLWELSGILTISLGKWGTIKLHGYLVWVGFIYASIGTYLAFKIGRPLVGLNFEQQRREANFRFAMIDVRSHSENVALYRGENQQKGVLRKIFSGVLDNWYMIILRQKMLLWFTASYNQVAVLIPLAVALPNYFNKVFKLGGLIQALRAFDRIQDALSFLVSAYVTIAEWRAVMRRLITFLNHMYELDMNVDKQNKISFVSSKSKKIFTKNMNINTPKGEKLLENLTHEFEHGKNYVIKGPSGIGKSTFVRALAGIWPFGEGEVGLPEKNNIMFLSQNSYMPIGSLRAALIFPEKSSPCSDDTLKKLLKACKLDHLIGELDEVAAWAERLSPGELQRIAFLRVLLHKPEWAFLDETSSSLDLANEKLMYDQIKKYVPHCSVVSVGHRPSVNAYHDVEINLEKNSPSFH